MKAPLIHRVRTGATGEGLRFAAVGLAATGAQLALYAFLDSSVGPQLANVLAWIASTLVANAAHRRYTFRLTGRASETDHLVGVVSSLAALGLSSLALLLLDEPTGLDGVVALVAVNAAVGAVRFLALRWWWLGPRRRVAGARVGRAGAGLTRPERRQPPGTVGWANDRRIPPHPDPCAACEVRLPTGCGRS